MRVAALYDIHGNLPALEAVLRDIRRAQVDHVIVGGDVVPGPMPHECIDRLRTIDVPVQFIHGNGDREVAAQKAGIESAAIPERFRESMRWNARQLSEEEAEFLASWPPTVRIPIDGIGSVLFCHATPRNDTDVFTRLTPDEEFATIFSGINADLIVCGHSHMQFDRKVGRLRVINAGSVGMPFGKPGAYWLLLGVDVEFRHTSYDLADAALRIRATGDPQAEDFAAKNVLQPPSEEEMLKVFGKIQLK